MTQQRLDKPTTKQSQISVRGGPGQDHYWRPLPTLKCYNLHALTTVIITKYIYIFCGGPLVVEVRGQLPSLPPPPPKSGPAVCSESGQAFQGFSSVLLADFTDLCGSPTLNRDKDAKIFDLAAALNHRRRCATCVEQSARLTTQTVVSS